MKRILDISFFFFFFRGARNDPISKNITETTSQFIFIHNEKYYSYSIECHQRCRHLNDISNLLFICYFGMLCLSTIPMMSYLLYEYFPTVVMSIRENGGIVMWKYVSIHNAIAIHVMIMAYIHHLSLMCKFVSICSFPTTNSIFRISAWHKQTEFDEALFQWRIKLEFELTVTRSLFPYRFLSYWFICMCVCVCHWLLDKCVSGG